VGEDCETEIKVECLEKDNEGIEDIIQNEKNNKELMSKDNGSFRFMENKIKFDDCLLIGDFVPLNDDNIMENIRMRILSEFYILDSFFPKFIKKINAILSQSRKIFHQESNFHKIKYFKLKLEKEINSLFAYEEKNNLIKILNNRFSGKNFNKIRNLKSNKCRNMIDYIIKYSEVEREETEENHKQMADFNSIELPFSEELHLKANKLLNYDFADIEKKQLSLKSLDSNDKAIFSIDIGLDSKIEEDESNLLNKDKNKNKKNGFQAEDSKDKFIKNNDNPLLIKIDTDLIEKALNKDLDYFDSKIENENENELGQEEQSKNNLKTKEKLMEYFAPYELTNSIPIEKSQKKKFIKEKKLVIKENKYNLLNKIQNEEEEKEKEKEKSSFKILRDRKNGYLKYIGEVLNNKYHGRGIYFHSNGTIKYKGYFKNNKYDGLGFYLTSEGKMLFLGQFKEDFSNGSGVEFTNNSENSLLNSSYSANSQNNEKLTIFTHADENEFLSSESCSLSNNTQQNDSAGKFNFEYSLRITSNFYKDMQAGYGIYFNEDNSIYEGRFLNGKLFDFGTYYNQKGFVEYQGFFYNDKYNGIGIYYMEKEKMFYFGDLENNEYEGYGIFLDKNMKIIHKGEYKNGEGCGFGKWFNCENQKLEYEGFFKNGYYGGIGVLYDSFTGNVKYIGKFKAGKIIQKITTGKQLSREEIKDVILKKFGVSLDEKEESLDRRMGNLLKYLNRMKENQLTIFK